MDDDEYGYAGDLVRTAEDHLDRAHALLAEARKILTREVTP